MQCKSGLMKRHGRACQRDQKLVLDVRPDISVSLAFTLELYLVLGLGFGWLKWAGQNGELHILQLLWHLRVAHVLVHNNAIHQLCIL